MRTVVVTPATQYRRRPPSESPQHPDPPPRCGAEWRGLRCHLDHDHQTRRGTPHAVVTVRGESGQVKRWTDDDIDDLDLERTLIG